MNDSHTTGETWLEFLVAAENKIRAARYHKGILKGEVLDLESRHVNQPTDKLQAHFEGVLYSYLAAIDQTRKVMMKGFKLRFDRPEPCPTCRKSPRVSDRFEDVVAKVPDSDLRQRFLDWHDQPILKDARNIRNRATHARYRKELSIQRWVVQEPNDCSPYGGPRWLVDYCGAVITHLEDLPLGELRHQIRVARGLPTTWKPVVQAESRPAGA